MSRRTHSQKSAPEPTVEAWAQGLQRQHAWLRAVACTRSGERQAVDDIMQEVALAAAQGYAKLRDSSRLEAWLYRLTVTAALQHRRRAGRQRKLIDRVAANQFDHEQTECDPLDWLLEREQSSLVRQALDRLPPKDTEIMILKYAFDWTYVELAERLGTSPAAVDGRLQRARAKLRRALAGSHASAVTS